jgi:aerobic-type carbon monoxide dehydrogenase small subunit (CoxS/CutS family)
LKGWPPDGTLHPVQQAVIDEQGFQCAFCMSGFMMSTVGFLKTESQSDARRTGARHLRQSLPLPGLQQDPRLDDARRREHEEGLSMADS